MQQYMYLYILVLRNFFAIWTKYKFWMRSVASCGKRPCFFKCTSKFLFVKPCFPKASVLFPSLVGKLKFSDICLLKTPLIPPILFLSATTNRNTPAFRSATRIRNIAGFKTISSSWPPDFLLLCFSCLQFLVFVFIIIISI